MQEYFIEMQLILDYQLLECDEAVKSIEAGDELEVNFDTGVIKNLTKDEEYQGEAFPEFMQNIINNNGLIGYIRK